VIYHLYGVRLHSAWRLPYSQTIQPFVADVVLTRRPARWFRDARRASLALPQPWATLVQGTLADGRVYLQWPDRFEFLIAPDGSEIAGRQLSAGVPEGFHSYLLGQALSFALIRHGLDPLHATVVTVGERGAAFLGDSGYGKSSLAAAFLAAGHRLLTDDLLVLTDGQRELSAHPGPPRLKLYQSSARRLLPGVRGRRMMRSTPKLLFPLRARQLAGGPATLGVMYVLAPPHPLRPPSRVTIRRLNGRQACLAMLRNTFNAAVVTPERLARQFAQSARLAASVPVKALTYPRSYRVLPAVRDAILEDLDREGLRVEEAVDREPPAAP
jgi:hypothetical protein